MVRFWGVKKHTHCTETVRTPNRFRCYPERGFDARRREQAVCFGPRRWQTRELLRAL